MCGGRSYVKKEMSEAAQSGDPEMWLCSKGKENGSNEERKNVVESHQLKQDTPTHNRVDV